jgi:membrane-associated phospholipid phosphatase
MLYAHITNPYIYGVVILWQLLSHLLNVVIKNTIKAPRPDSDPKEFNAIKNNVSWNNYLTIHRNFGMPSGHAQAVMSEFMFIALYFKQPILTTVAAIQVGITLWQRYTTRRHSIEQLSAGSILGIGIGYMFYKLAKVYI